MVTGFKASLLVMAIALATPAAAAPTAYTGLTLIDPVAETRTPDSYILVDGERIVGIGQGEPPADIPASARHDLRGRFAMPGLFDTHVHLSLGPLRGRAVDGQPVFSAQGNESITRHAALMLLAHGVTSVRDPGGESEALVAYREKVEAGQWLGPEARVAGKIIHRSPFPVEALIVPITDPDEIAPEIERQAAIGVDYIKLYEELTAEDLGAGVAAADERGLGTIAHVRDVSWTQAAELGIDALVHIIPSSPDLIPADRRAAYLAARRPGPYMFFEWFEHADLDAPEIRTMIETLARRGVWFDATIIAFQLAFWGDDLRVRDADVGSAHPAFVENWLNAFRFDWGWAPSDYQRAKAIWPKMLRLVRMMHEGGVPMTIGTDMNNPFVAPGASLSREMQFHAEAGISNWAVLRMATSEAARSLGMAERTGRLQAGMEADILFLSADPSLDLAATAHPVEVMANGRRLDPFELRAQALVIATEAPAQP